MAATYINEVFMKKYIICNGGVEYDNEGNIVPPNLANALKHSKIRNRKGELLVCYHGTNAQFEDFKDDFISTSSGNFGWFGVGFYFTDSLKLAQSYGSIQRKCYLNITKPFVYSSKDNVYELLLLGVEPRSYDGHLMPYAYMDDNKPVEVFTTAIKNAGYDGVKYSYRQANYRPNVSGASNASEFVCFNTNQIYFID